jgi:hypothetical protein
MMLRRLLAVSLILSLFSLPVLSQTALTPPPPTNGDELVRQMRNEALGRSQIMKTMHMLTDVYGPRRRLTTSAR